MSRSTNHRTPNVPTPKANPVQRGTSRLWFLGALFVLVAVATWAVFEFVVWNSLPPGLVGKWVVSEGPQEGATFDFFRDGSMIGRINHGGKLAIINAKVRVEEKKLYSTTTHPQTGKEQTLIQTIRLLTAERLVIEDDKGSQMRMERADR